MIGRGVFQNPFCFEKTPTEHNKNELIDLLKYHLDLYDQDDENIRPPFDTLKRFFKIYINSFPGASDLRVKLMDSKTTLEVREILKSA
jgi:tRNA-dihydrouridine synthase